MTPRDDNNLIEALSSGLAQRQAGVSAPAGIGDGARRIARRRRATTLVAGAVPVLAAAGVTTVLATGGSASPHAAASPVVAGHQPSPPRVVDTAYIVKHVRARLAHDAADGTVVHTLQYTKGDVSADGTLENLGAAYLDGWSYDDPDGDEYLHLTMYNPDGSVWYHEAYDWTPTASGKGNLSKILISPSQQDYSENSYTGIDPTDGGGPSVFSSASQVQQALQNGQVTQTGTGTVAGQSAIALAVALPKDAAGEHFTLWVDAETYQPLMDVITADGFSSLLVDEWAPATAANVAQAENESVPAGYTKVSENTVAPAEK